MTSRPRELAAQAVRAHTPELRDLEILELGHGLDSVAHAVGDLVVRVGRDGSAAREARLLEAVGARVSIPVPAARPLHRRRRRDRHPDHVLLDVAATREISVAWTAVTAAGWSLGWLVTSQVIVDIERGHHVFGSSGALLLTALTGLALRGMASTETNAQRPPRGAGAGMRLS